MSATKKPTIAKLLFVLVSAWAVSFLAAGERMQAQQTPVAGNKAVYTSGGSNGTCCAASTVYIDASVLSGSNICEQIFNALNMLINSHTSAVVDARGVNLSSACQTQGAETPWHGSSGDVVTPATILLPAGTIQMSSPWIVPDGTRLVGEGIGGEGSGSNTGGTIIQAPANFSGPMIKMGDSGVHCPAAGHICHGIAVEDLTLDGEGGQGVNGITNNSSQDQSYVNHVKLYQILGTGISVGGNAQHSGPYTNITFDTSGSSPVPATACAQINVLNGTRGIHGLTCIASSNFPTAAVYLDSSNNSLEDVRIIGFNDGILIGSQAVARSNVLFNVWGDTTRNGVVPVRVVHISVNNTVSDLSIVGANNPLGSATNGEYTIADDQTLSTKIADKYVAIYALGEQSGGGYSRFTTSPNAASWVVGNGAPNASGCAASNYGSLYSNTSSSGGGVLWVCENQSGHPTWVNIH